MSKLDNVKNKIKSKKMKSQKTEISKNMKTKYFLNSKMSELNQCQCHAI